MCALCASTLTGANGNNRGTGRNAGLPWQCSARWQAEEFLPLQLTVEKLGQLEADLAHWHGERVSQDTSMHPLALGDLAVRKH